MSSDEQKLLNISEAARRLGVSVTFLNRERYRGEGPAYLKLGARVVYAPADLAAWLETKRRSASVPTSASAGAGQ